MALASGNDARARGVHGVGVEVFSFCPEVFSFRANVFSFGRFPPPRCSLFGAMCSVGVADVLAPAASLRRSQGPLRGPALRVTAQTLTHT